MLLVMLVLVLLVQVVLPYLFHPLSLLSFRNFSDWSGFANHSSYWADQLLLSDELLQAVLAEAQVVFIGQPMLIAGDLNVDPAVIPCLSKGISAGRYVDLALAYYLGAGFAPDVICRFSREDGTGSRRDFFVGCPGALAASQACYVTDRWFTPHCSELARFRLGAWTADVACPVVCQPISPACWLDTPDRSSTRPLELSRMFGISFEMYSVRFRRRLFLHFGMPSLGLLLMIFGLFGVVVLRRVYFGLILKLEVLLLLAALPFLAEVCYGFAAGVWEAELLVVQFLVGSIG